MFARLRRLPHCAMLVTCMYWWPRGVIRVASRLVIILIAARRELAEHGYADALLRRGYLWSLNGRSARRPCLIEAGLSVAPISDQRSRRPVASWRCARHQKRRKESKRGFCTWTGLLIQVCLRAVASHPLSLEQHPSRSLKIRARYALEGCSKRVVSELAEV